MRPCNLPPPSHTSLTPIQPPPPCSVAAPTPLPSLQIYVGGKLWHPNSQSNSLRYNPCRTAGRQGRTLMQDTKAFLGVGVGVSHWGDVQELVRYEAHDLGLAASMLGEGWLDSALVRCRTGAHLQVPCDGGGGGVCDGDGDPRALVHMRGSGFEWYDTSSRHIVSNITFARCGARSPGVHQPASGVEAEEQGCGDGQTGGCHPHSSVWALLTHSDQFTPEYMQGKREPPPPSGVRESPHPLAPST